MTRLKNARKQTVSGPGVGSGSGGLIRGFAELNAVHDAATVYADVF